MPSWTWRGKQFWLETVAGNSEPKLALFGSLLKLSRPK